MKQPPEVPAGQIAAEIDLGGQLKAGTRIIAVDVIVVVRRECNQVFVRVHKDRVMIVSDDRPVRVHSLCEEFRYVRFIAGVEHAHLHTQRPPGILIRIIADAEEQAVAECLQVFRETRYLELA